MIDIKHLGNNTRELPCVTFQDEWGNPIKLQISSAAGKEGVWFGFATLMSHPMHLTRAEVAKLLPYLQKFVETGDFESAQL